MNRILNYALDNREIVLITGCVISLYLVLFSSDMPWQLSVMAYLFGFSIIFDNEYIKRLERKE